MSSNSPSVTTQNQSFETEQLFKSCVVKQSSIFEAIDTKGHNTLMKRSNAEIKSVLHQFYVV